MAGVELEQYTGLHMYIECLHADKPYICDSGINACIAYCSRERVVYSAR